MTAALTALSLEREASRSEFTALIALLDRLADHRLQQLFCQALRELVGLFTTCKSGQCVAKVHEMFGSFDQRADGPQEELDFYRMLRTLIRDFYQTAHVASASHNRSG